MDRKIVEIEHVKCYVTLTPCRGGIEEVWKYKRIITNGLWIVFADRFPGFIVDNFVKTRDNATRKHRDGRIYCDTKDMELWYFVLSKRRYPALFPNGQSLERARFLNHPDLDISLANWILQTEYWKIRINDEIIKASIYSSPFHNESNNILKWMVRIF